MGVAWWDVISYHISVAFSFPEILHATRVSTNTVLIQSLMHLSTWRKATFPGNQTPCSIGRSDLLPGLSLLPLHDSILVPHQLVQHLNNCSALQPTFAQILVIVQVKINLKCYCFSIKPLSVRFWILACSLCCLGHPFTLKSFVYCCVIVSVQRIFLLYKIQ